MDPYKRNQHLTHKANAGVGRHGWLRLTPAYSVQLVRDHVARLPQLAVVTDPFSGSGTTALAAAEHGCVGQAADLNPFLVWLGTAKVRCYQADLIDGVLDAVPEVVRRSERLLADAADLWAPRLHNIDRWWSPGSLAALKAIRRALDECCLPVAGADLLSIAFCRTLIAASNAAFNHQSMSFAVPPRAAPPVSQALPIIQRFAAEALSIAASAAEPLPGAGVIVRADSRAIDAAPLDRCDLLLTSPPYVNRMSYIRELRPYMYWLRFLDKASDAGELDWQAIGGTWGIATSRLSDWAPGDSATRTSPSGNSPSGNGASGNGASGNGASSDGASGDWAALPMARELREVCGVIEKDGGKNGPLLSSYVAKYFFDMSEHIRSAFDAVRSGGRAAYIIGNSTFYGHLVPAQDWYAALLRATGFTDVSVTTIRKRNSNKALYEYEVSGTRP
jgi:hypothetical protein